MIALLLLDLDGVVVVESTPPEVAALEIILLHDVLAEVLCNINCPVVVLTHRSSVEAKLILRLAGLTVGQNLAGLFAAEDILKAALRIKRPWRLLRHGLKKSWILPTLDAQFGLDRRTVAFVDDRRDNLEDLLEHGIGLGLHAPSGFAADGSNLVSFDFSAVIRLLQTWHGGAPEIIAVPPRTISSEHWQRTGTNTGSVTRHGFNRLRRYGRMVRHLPLLRHGG